MPELGESCAWFALTVKPRHEKAAAQNLRSKGLEVMLPMYLVRRQWSDRLKTVEMPLFPGYVFCRVGREERLKALTTPSVTSIVGFANIPAPIPEDQIAAVRRMAESRLLVQPWPYLRPGEQVRIDSGALAGVCGTLVRGKSVFRLVVNIELLQRSVAVEVDRAALSPVNRPYSAAFAELCRAAEAGR